MGATSLVDGAYQIAASLEGDSTAKKALVMGTFSPRSTTASGTAGAISSNVYNINLTWSTFSKTISTDFKYSFSA